MTITLEQALKSTLFTQSYADELARAKALVEARAILKQTIDKIEAANLRTSVALRTLRESRTQLELIKKDARNYMQYYGLTLTQAANFSTPDALYRQRAQLAGHKQADLKSHRKQILEVRPRNLHKRMPTASGNPFAGIK